MPAPFLMARSMVSLVTEDFLAFSTATNNRALRSGSAPPSLAATMISRTSLTTIWPFLCALASRPACFHCAPISLDQCGKNAGLRKLNCFNHNGSRPNERNSRIDFMATDAEAEVLVFEAAETRNTGNVVDDTFTAPDGIAI